MTAQETSHTPASAVQEVPESIQEETITILAKLHPGANRERINHMYNKIIPQVGTTPGHIDVAIGTLINDKEEGLQTALTVRLERRDGAVMAIDQTKKNENEYPLHLIVKKALQMKFSLFVVHTVGPYDEEPEEVFVLKAPSQKKRGRPTGAKTVSTKLDTKTPRSKHGMPDPYPSDSFTYKGIPLMDMHESQRRQIYIQLGLNDPEASTLEAAISFPRGTSGSFKQISKLADTSPGSASYRLGRIKEKLGEVK